MPSTSKSEWEKNTLDPLKKRFGERQEAFETESGLPVKTTYTPEDLGDSDVGEKLGYPGEYPFTPRRPAEYVSRPRMDDAAVFRVRLA